MNDYEWVWKRYCKTIFDHQRQRTKDAQNDERFFKIFNMWIQFVPLPDARKGLETHCNQKIWNLSHSKNMIWKQNGCVACSSSLNQLRCRLGRYLCCSFSCFCQTSDCKTGTDMTVRHSWWTNAVKWQILNIGWNNVSCGIFQIQIISVKMNFIIPKEESSPVSDLRFTKLSKQLQRWFFCTWRKVFVYYFRSVLGLIKRSICW